MTNKNLKIFALNYAAKDFSKIKFDWNGKYGDEFEDSNYDFRMKLCEAIKDDLTPYSDQLIIDLYSQLAASSPATFGVYMSFHLFANELLERGGAKYFDIYAEGASKSMDTGLSSGRLNLSDKTIDEILAYINAEIAKGVDMEFMKKRFERQKQKNDSQ